LGPEAEADVDAGFDADDELAFISLDCGDRLEGVQWSQPPKIWLEIEVFDPVDQGRGYVYLAAFSGPAPRSQVDYISCHAAENIIESTDYKIGYHPDAPISINWLSVPPSGGGSGQSVADRQKIRAKATMIWNLFSISKNESDFRAVVSAYADGPVRVIRRTRNWVRLVGRIPSPSVELESIYWKTGMRFPLRILVPFRISHFFRDVSLRIYVDTPPDVPGRVFFNANNPGGVMIDGRMSDAERKMDFAPSVWQVVAGSTPAHREGWFSRQVHDSQKMPVTLPVYYLDDAATPDGPERYSGCFGCLGFELDGLEYLDAGTYSVFVQMYPMRSYNPGDEKKYLNVHDRPLQVRSKLLAKP